MANSNQNIETPWNFINAVQDYFNISFTYDMACTTENKRAMIGFTEEQDSLSIDWPLERWCWSNPPFKNIGKWTDKYHEQKKRGSMIISISPLSGDLNQVKAFQNAGVYIIHGRVWPEVRGVMLSVWHPMASGVHGLNWNKKDGTLTKVWG